MEEKLLPHRASIEEDNIRRNGDWPMSASLERNKP
jgi:hypothetical protein